MKKHQFYLWLIALAGLITSCSQDETDAPAAGESNRVSFTASLPADFAQPGTRALPTPPNDYAGNSYKLRCILEVWSKDLSTLIVRKEEVPAADATDIKFEFELANPADYKALFWADYITPTANETSQTTPNSYTHYRDNCYTTNKTDGLKAVEISNYPTDPLLRDAFFACKDFTKGVGALTDFKATLVRPFAKLTIAEKNATNFGYCKGVYVTHDIPKTLNVATGAVSGTFTITSLGYSKSDVGGFGNEVTINGKACKTLLFTYIFAGDDDTAGEIALEFTPADGSGKTLKSVTIPAGIPLKRNYCTNAAGSLITEAVTPSPNTVMTVDITDEWETPDSEYDIPNTVWDGTTTSQPAGYDAFTPGEVDITTAAELAWLAQQRQTFEGYTFRLTADIDLNDYEWTPIGSNRTFQGTFDGQGYTVSNLQCTTSSKAGLFAEISGATVKDVTVSGTVSFTASEVCKLGGIVAYVTDNNTITGCTNHCTITATGDDNQCHVGGIAGYVANLSANSNSTISDNTNTGTLVTNGYISSSVGGIIGTATATQSSSITLTRNNYSGGTPSDVCIGDCFMDNGTITIDGTGATINKPFPVPQP